MLVGWIYTTLVNSGWDKALPTAAGLPLLHGQTRSSDLIPIEVGTPAEPGASITLHPPEVPLRGATWNGGSQEFPLLGLFLSEVTRGVGLVTAAPLLFTKARVCVLVTRVKEWLHACLSLVVLHFRHFHFVQMVVLVLVQLMELPHH